MRDLLEEASAKRLELRPHQSKAIAMIRQSLGSGNRRVVLQGGVGFGKTLCAARIIEGALAKGNKVIFTAPAISLIDQTVARLENEGIHDIGVIQANHPRTNSLAPVQVASVQSLARRDVPQAAMIIVDEAHIRAEIIDRLMVERPDVFFIGLSATPWRKGMGLLWQDLVIPITVPELVAGGYLSESVVYAPDVPDLSGVKTRAGEYVEGDLERVMREGGLIGSVVETWLAKGEDRPTLVFAVNRAHAADLHAGFEAAGVSSAYVDGEVDSIERQIISRQFMAGDIRVICSVRTMTTGVDLPVSCIVDAAPTRSEMLHVQKIGRGMRVNPGTEDLIVLDHAGNSLRLGLIGDIHHERLDDTKPGEKQKAKDAPERLPKPCVVCGALHIGRVCPACGHERRPQAGVETAAGELVHVSGKARPMTKDDKQAWWSGMLHIASKRGRSRVWAAHSYKAKSGVWPRGLADVRGDPTPEMWNWVKSRDIAYAKSREARRVS